VITADLAVADVQPIEIDPRPCVCGATIDQHLRVDTPEGPEFFCLCDLCGLTVDHHDTADTPTGQQWFCREIFNDGGAAGTVRAWELADPRDSWQHTGEAPPPASVRNGAIVASPERADQYRTPQSVIDAFFFVVRTKDAAGIAAWLADHPRDENHLKKIWERKCSTAAAK
jgi:hypothetical protein